MPQQIVWSLILFLGVLVHSTTFYTTKVILKKKDVRTCRNYIIYYQCYFLNIDGMILRLSYLQITDIAIDAKIAFLADGYWTVAKRIRDY